MSEQPVFYNTINIGDQNLLNAIENAKKQEDRIMVIMQAKRRPMSPSQVLEVYKSWFAGNTPLTSIRRAMSNLTKADKLEMLEDRIQGIYGQPEHKWQLPESKPVQTKINF